jgi:transposase InsO family protein
MERRQREYSEDVKKTVGRNLLMAPRGSQKLTADLLKVSTRTLRSWKKNHNQEPKIRGRKRTRVTFKELFKITREWKRQGYPGSRPIIYALPDLRVRLVQEVIAALKTKKKKRFCKIRETLRVSVVVHNPGTVTAMDAAAIKKGEDFIVTKDRGSLKITTSECGGHVNSDNTINALNSLKTEGRLPYVVCTDNGSPFVSEIVETFLVANKVVHLKSMPYVPEHNGSAESAVNDVKLLANDGITLDKACTILNDNRKRRKLNYKTSKEFELEKLELCTEKDRAVFFEATCTAINSAVLGIDCAHEKRKAERKAIFETMERFSLITINRGLRHA